ncbi:hypothetical protein HC928_22575 [bacterium]|nr:hypothetical protein [bacterium]
MRSPIIERDFLLEDELVPETAFVPTPNGFQYIVHPIGPSIFWSPFFLIAHALTTLSLLPYPNDGLSPPYIAIVAAGSTLYGLTGLLIVYKTCRLYTSHSPAFLTTVTILCASPLLYYLYRQPMMAHSASFFVCALLLYVLSLLDKAVLPIRLSGFLLGTIIGLAILVRWLNVFLIPLPAALFVNLFIHHVQLKDWKSLRMLVLQGVVASISAVLVLLPQFAVWQIIYEYWFVFPQGRSGLSLQNMYNIFFHSNRGLVFWVPLVPLGILTLFQIDPFWLRISGILSVVFCIFIIGTRDDWYSGGGYSARYFIETLPILAIGLAQLSNTFWHKLSLRWMITGFSFLLCLYQFSLMIMVEQVSSGLDLAAYLSGQSLDVAIFKTSISDLLKSPSLLYAIRPNVLDERQTILASLVHGIRDFQVYTINLIGLPVVFLGFMLVLACGSMRWLVPSLVGISLYCVGWFLLLLSL